MTLTCQLELCEKFDICDQCSASMYSAESSDYYSDSDGERSDGERNDNEQSDQGYPLQTLFSLGAAIGGFILGSLLYRSYR